jgi:hypothetical protein
MAPARQAHVYVGVGGAMSGQCRCTEKAVRAQHRMSFRDGLQPPVRSRQGHSWPSFSKKKNTEPGIPCVFPYLGYSKAYGRVRDGHVGIRRPTGESRMCTGLCKGTWVYSHAGTPWLALGTGESRTDTLCKGMSVHSHAGTGESRTATCLCMTSLSKHVIPTTLRNAISSSKHVIPTTLRTVASHARARYARASGCIPMLALASTLGARMR